MSKTFVPSEKQIEARLVLGVRERLKGIALKTYQHPGMPDRVLILPNGKMVFVEVKASGGRVSDVQQIKIAQLIALGHDVRIVYGYDGVDALLDELQ